MCQFSYYHSEECGHQAIEISSYCSTSTWAAGLTGILRPCAEKTYASVVAGLEKNPSSWQGLSSFCRKCEVGFKMGKVLRLPTDNDIPMTLPPRNNSPRKQNNFVITTPYTMRTFGPPLNRSATLDNAVLPTSTSGLPTANIYSPANLSPDTNNQESQPAQGNNHLLLDKSDLDLLAVLEDQPYPPFIYRPGLCGTVCQLLSIENQFESYPAFSHPHYKIYVDAMRTTIYFPPSLEIYDCRAADPSRNDYWTGRATIDGLELLPGVYPSNYFAAKGGFTPLDLSYLLEKLKSGDLPKKVWSERFEQRGMPLEYFNRHFVTIQRDVAQKWADRFQGKTTADIAAQHIVKANDIPVQPKQEPADIQPLRFLPPIFTIKAPTVDPFR